MRTKSLFTASLLTLAATMALVSSVPTVSAHNCESIVGPVGCGSCADLDHTGTHYWSVGSRNIPYCSVVVLPGDGGEDPLCSVLTMTALGSCGESSAEAVAAGDCWAPTGPVQCGPTCAPGEDKYLAIGDLLVVQYC